jgi:riboflavin kinase/FMN adenylyltransferase
MSQGAAGFVCGHDFRFGHRGEGTPEKLQEFYRQQNLPCVIVPEQDIGGIRISSSYIRQQLESGDMTTAVRFLGHPYLLSGTVIHGKKIGRTLGIPTANLVIPEGLVIPKFGVYACACLIDGMRYPAVTNIGTRPTVSGRGITVEPWILDFSGDLYDKTITLEFYRFLRPETRFPDLPSLQQQIHRDAEQTRIFLKEQI